MGLNSRKKSMAVRVCALAKSQRSRQMDFTSLFFFHECGRRVGMVPRSPLKEGKNRQMVEKGTNGLHITLPVTSGHCTEWQKPGNVKSRALVLRRPHLECPVFLRQQKPQNQVRNFASGSQTWAYCGTREYMKQEQTGPATPSYFSVRLQKTQERVSMSQKLSSCPNNT